MASYYTIDPFKSLTCFQSTQFERVASNAVEFRPSLGINRYDNHEYKPQSTSKSSELHVCT